MSLLHAATNAHDLLVNLGKYVEADQPIKGTGHDLEIAEFVEQLGVAITDAEATAPTRVDSNGDDAWFVMWPGGWDNPLSETPELKDWWAIGHADLGIIAYAMTEDIANKVRAALEA